ncbi:MAG: hypothetical protein FWF43_05470 [Propionibacteriaceae bacterium]|nr:hypothetical protein [Propionibacteriaceae bacterium]
MARIVGNDHHIHDGPAVALSVADVLAMTDPVAALKPADRAVAARAAIDEWGFAGVGVRRDAHWIGVVLIAPQHGLPRSHPLSAGGIDSQTAGLVLVHIDPGETAGTGKRLCVGLCHRLRDQVTGIEAQAGLVPRTTSTLAPSAHWLVRMGFQPLRYPLNRYRMDFATLVTWIQRRVQWYPRPVLGLVPGHASTSSVLRHGERHDVDLRV